MGDVVAAGALLSAQLAVQVLDVLPGPLFVVGPDGRLIYVNRAAEADLGVRREKVLGRFLADALYGGEKFDFRGRYRSALLETVETGREFSLRTVEVKTIFNRLPKTYLVDTFVLAGPDGKMLGACAAYHDVSRDRRLLKQAVISRLASASEHFETIYAFAEAIGARDLYTMGHSEKVAEYARLIADQLGLDDSEVDRAYLCGIVHDVGKIGVPEDILNKPGPLSPDEFAQITHHPDMGATILSHISWLEDVVPVIMAHHERYDGKGYPRGLQGEEIPLLSRILAVADAFDAMTSDRSYRKALPLKTALDELRRGAGCQFDPRVVDAFLSMLDNYEN
ncbi:HD-GYP domain-containing protein [Desulfotomaculum copahuensis]|uniref:PAS sensor protein n=1 Tax=Desulfotomaculum copahuensis TaxID=1838280 RepID=A0A1B7LHZ3_9FIRM|nr:HD domain-containing phosphohydrolase [Desulfotomaculum copahuensis]OAT85916.1 PAS sensor protein [Desulfotomaculum copahuensis]